MVWGQGTLCFGTYLFSYLYHFSSLSQDTLNFSQQEMPFNSLLETCSVSLEKNVEVTRQETEIMGKTLDLTSDHAVCSKAASLHLRKGLLSKAALAQGDVRIFFFSLLTSVL